MGHDNGDGLCFICCINCNSYKYVLILVFLVILFLSCRTKIIQKGKLLIS